MPGSVNNASPVGVLPFSLCTQLVESRVWPVRTSEYHDGSQDRMSLATSARRSWKMSKRLTGSALVALRNFLDAHPVDAFYIYSMKDTSPAFTWDATGVATAGRYTVRAAWGEWNQQTYIPRADCAVEFVEVA